MNKIVNTCKTINNKIWENKVLALIIFAIAVIIPFGVTALVALNGNKFINIVKNFKKDEVSL